MAATSSANKVFFAGGMAQFNSISDRVDIIDVTSKKSSIASLSQARHHLTATALGNKVFFAGGTVSGLTIGPFSDRVDIYDTVTGQWSTATLSQARRDPSATSVGTKVLIAGGILAYNTSSNVVDIYDTTTGVWSTHTLSVTRGAVASTTVGTKAYFAGGIENERRIDIYDSASDTWTTDTLPNVLGGVVATSMSTKAFFAISGSQKNTVDVYDDATQKWSTDTLSQNRFDITATSAGDKAFFAGGGYLPPNVYSQSFSDVVDIYDNSTGKWTVSKLSKARSALSSTSSNGKAFFAGGYSDLYILSDVVDIYETATTSFGITGVTSLTCTPLTPTRFNVSFTPSYSGVTGQPISFSVVNELLPTTQPAPYTISLYTDNPVIVLQASQQGTATPASFVYNWLAACTNAPSPSLRIVGVTMVKCKTVTPTERLLTFSPQYTGQSSAPISFSVVNELLPTSSPGPYTIRLYIDNPSVTLSAQQGSAVSTYRYNWLSVCNPTGRLGLGEAESALIVRVLGNPLTSDAVEVQVQGAQGQPVQLRLTDLQGQLVSERSIQQAGLVESLRLPVTSHLTGLLLLRVSTPSQSQTLKVLKP